MTYLIAISFTFLCGICIYLLFKKKNYTRERFAFFSTLLIISYASSVFLHLFVDISLIKLFVLTFNILPLEDIPVSETSWSDKLWAILFLIIIIAFIITIYESWWKEGNGAVSEKDFQLYKRKKELGYLQAAKDGFPGRNLVCTRIEERDHVTGFSETYNLDENLSWHSEARDMLLMLSGQYKIKKNEWHSEERVYLSKYSDQSILVLCTYDNPENSVIEELINKFNYKMNHGVSKVIVMVKDSCIDVSKSTINGVEVEFKKKEDLLDNLVNFQDYFSYIETQYSNTEITAGDGTTLDSIYVESDARLIDLKNDNNSLKIKNIESYLLNWAKDGDCEKQISLLGEYGQGKSVLSLKLAYEMIKNGFKRVPIIIELRGKSPRNETISTIIASWAYTFNLNVLAIQKLLQEGRLLIILEGFDELDMVGDSHRRLEHFKRLWEFARYKNSKVIITGRPNLFLDNKEARNYLHLNNDSSNIFYSQAIHLETFSPDKIEQSLRSVNPRVKSEMLDLIKSKGETSSFFDLISRPSTLYQTSIIWDSLDKNFVSSASVIDKFIKHASRRQAEKLRNLGPTGIESPVLTAKERDYFMLGCAVGLIHDNGYSNQVSGSELRSVVTKLFYEAPDSISMDHSDALPLRLRLIDDKNAVESVFNDVRTAGILVKDLTGDNVFKFAHKSFLELLFAKYFVGHISTEDEVIVNSISRALAVEKKIFDFEYSDEVINHISELLNNEVSDKYTKRHVAEKILHAINPSVLLWDRVFFKETLFFPNYIFYMLCVFSSGFAYSIYFDRPFFGSFESRSGVSLIISIFVMYTVFKYIVLIKNRASYNVWIVMCKKIPFDYKNEVIVSKSLQIFYEKVCKRIDDSISFLTINVLIPGIKFFLFSREPRDLRDEKK